jgi:hypothetical protein
MAVTQSSDEVTIGGTRQGVKEQERRNATNDLSTVNCDANLDYYRKA